MSPTGTARLPARTDLLLTARAVLVGGLVELGLRALPLEQLAGSLGVGIRFGAAPSGATEGAPSDHQRAIRATDRALRLLHRCERPCLRRALILGHLLRRNGPALRLGVAREDGEVRAHAWLEVDGVAVGEPAPVLDRFVPLRRA